MASSSVKSAAVLRLESYATAKAFSAEVLAAKLSRADSARAAKVAARAEKASRAFMHAKAVHEAMHAKLTAALAATAAASAARVGAASLKRAQLVEAKVRAYACSSTHESEAARARACVCVCVCAWRACSSTSAWRNSRR
jgi:hypothetical protein